MLSTLISALSLAHGGGAAIAPEPNQTQVPDGKYYNVEVVVHYVKALMDLETANQGEPDFIMGVDIGRNWQPPKPGGSARKITTRCLTGETIRPEKDWKIEFDNCLIFDTEKVVLYLTLYEDDRSSGPDGMHGNAGDNMSPWGCNFTPWGTQSERFVVDVKTGIVTSASTQALAKSFRGRVGRPIGLMAAPKGIKRCSIQFTIKVTPIRKGNAMAGP